METNPLAPQAPRKLKGAEKAAALLLALGTDNASRMLAHLGENEIRAIARSGSDLGAVPYTALEDIANEFIGQMVGLDGGVRASAEQIEELLDKVLEPQQVRQIMSDVRSRMNEAIWPRLAETQAQVLAHFLSREHPQIIAFVLSKVPASLSAEAVAIFPSALRNEVMRRMLTNKLVIQHSLRLLEQVLREELLLKVARTSGQDTHARLAKIINKLSKRDMDEVLESLAATRPKAAETVRSLLFTFADIVKLPAKTRTLLFESVEADQIVPALNGADSALKELILSSVPMRTRRVIEQDLATAAPLSQKEVETARREIANQALQLAEEGIITLRIAEADE